MAATSEAKLANSEAELAKQLERFLAPTFELIVKYRMASSLNNKDRKALCAKLAAFAWPLRAGSDLEIHNQVYSFLADPARSPGPIADGIRAKGPKGIRVVAANVVGRIKSGY